ncbi:MAG: hypothetical protein JWN25_3350, partial [Verrucomicrobiales bacterium]|nr:hypothetical protein [Verrucomicrobiales bacterium]
MMDERLGRLLVRLDSHLAHARVRRKWAACGAAVTLSELVLFVVRVATGWKSQSMWLGILGAGAVTAWVIWIQGKNRKPEFGELVTFLSGQDKETGNLLATALEQKPNPETGYLTFLQSRVIDQVIEHPDKDLWFASVRKKADGARNLQIASIFCLITVLFLSAQPPSRRLHRVVAWFGPEIAVTPGDAEVERGNGVVVTARFGKEAPAEADMILLSSTGTEKRIPLARHLEDPVFGTSIPEVSEDAIYRIEYGNKKTRDFKLKVFDYPSMTRADASMNYPSYTGLTNRTIKDTVRVSAVEGTKITYNLELNKTVVKASLRSKEQTLALAVKTNAL